MKLKSLILGGMLAVSSSYTLSQENSGALYVGVKTGKMLVSVEESGVKASDPSSVGFVLGYDFGSGFALEFEANNSGKSDLSIYNTHAGEVEIETRALYLAMRSQGKGFFKGRIGVLQETATVSGCGYYTCGSEEEDDTGLSLGIGGGYNFNDTVQVEAEYTILEADVDLLSIGLNLRF